MIISKLERAKNAYTEALQSINDTLVTQRASSEARQEINELRAKSQETNICPYCEKPIVKRSVRHQEACHKCGALVDKLLQTKSKILNGSCEVGPLKQYAADLTKLKFVPYALRGATGELQDVTRALDFAITASINYQAEKREYNRREATRNLEAKRRKSILDLLIQCGADPDSEETQSRVDEIYWSRYADEAL